MRTRSSFGVEKASIGNVSFFSFPLFLVRRRGAAVSAPFFLLLTSPNLNPILFFTLLDKTKQASLVRQRSRAAATRPPAAIAASVAAAADSAKAAVLSALTAVLPASVASSLASPAASLALAALAALVAVLAIKKVFDTPSRTYDPANPNVGDEYDAWTR